MNQKSLFLALALVLALLAGCSSATPEPVSFDLHMTEYAFTPDTIEVKVGQQVTLNLINDGLLAHEVMFGRQVMQVENRPMGYMADMFESAGVEPVVSSAAGMEMDHHEEGHSGVMVVLEKTGDRATMTFTATEAMLGEWEMGCFEQDGVHHQAGMVGKFIVSN